MKIARSWLGIGLCGGLCLGTGGCWFGKKAPQIPVPVPAPQPAATQPAATQPASTQPPPTSAQAPKKTPPPKPAARSDTPPAPPVPAPQIQEIISGERRRQYESEYSQSVARADAALKRASATTLDASQRNTADRIRTFLAQANSAHDSDISTALQLARRADLLGQELLKSLK